jgi:hypothetical protein
VDRNNFAFYYPVFTLQTQTSNTNEMSQAVAGIKRAEGTGTSMAMLNRNKHGNAKQQQARQY